MRDPTTRWSDSGSGSHIRLVDDAVLLTGGGTVQLVDWLDGGVRWTYEVGDPIDPPLVAESRVYFGSSGEIYALSLEDGTENWTYDAGGWREPLSKPTAYDDRIVLSSHRRTICLTTAGDHEWTQPVGTGGAASVWDNWLIVVPDGDSIAGLLPSTGRQRRTIPAERTGSYVTVHNRDLYSAGSYVGKWDDTDDSWEWTQPLPSDAANELSFLYDLPLVATENGTIALVTDYDLVWAVDLNGTITTPIIDVDGHLYVGTDSGTVYQLSHDGAIDAELQFESSIDGTVRVCQRRIYAGTTEGTRVYSATDDEVTVRLDYLENRLDEYDDGELALDEPRDRLDEARDVSRTDPARALEIVSDGIDVLNALVADYERATSAIEALETRLEEEPASELETSDIESTLDAAIAAFEGGSYDRAAALANDGRADLDDLAAAATDAARAIDRLETQLRETEIDVDDLEAAETAYADGEYDRAREIATSALDEVADLEASADEARAAISDLESTLAETDFEEEWEDELEAAETAYADGEYDRAREIATSALDEVADLEAAAAAIADLESTLDETTVEAPESATLLADARREYDDAEFERAQALADRGQRRLEERTSQAGAAADEIEQLESAIDERSIRTPTATELLADARDAYDRGEYEAAGETAREGRTELERTIDDERDAADRIETLESELDAASDQGYELPNQQEALERAETAYEEGTYEEAEALAAAALADLDEAKRTEEALVRSEGGGVRTLAGDAVGRRSLLDDARSAYEAEEYDRAASLAAAADQRRQRANLALGTGTVLAAAGGGAVYARRRRIERRRQRTRDAFRSVKSDAERIQGRLPERSTALDKRLTRANPEGVEDRPEAKLPIERLEADLEQYEALVDELDRLGAENVPEPRADDLEARAEEALADDDVERIDELTTDVRAAIRNAGRESDPDVEFNADSALESEPDPDPESEPRTEDDAERSEPSDGGIEMND